MANGNSSNEMTAGAVITICLGMLVASNSIMFWGLNNLKEQIDEKASDRYTGAQAQSDKYVIDARLAGLEWRIIQLEEFVKRHRDEVERNNTNDS